MTVAAGSLHSGFGERPDTGLWLAGGAAVVVMHVAIVFGLGILLPRQVPPAPDPALTVELAPFTIPAAVEQDRDLLTGGTAPASALAPVRQAGSAPAALPGREPPIRAPRTVAEAIAAADAVDRAADKVRPVEHDRTASTGQPERARPVDGPRDVAEAISAAEIPPNAVPAERMEPVQAASEPAPTTQSVAAMMVRTPHSTLTMRPEAPVPATPVVPDTVLAGAEVTDVAPASANAAPPSTAEAPDPATPDLVALVPTRRPDESAAREAAVNRRLVLRGQATRAAAERAERQRAGRAAASAAEPAPQKALKPAATAGQPVTAFRGPLAPAVRSEGTGRPFRADRTVPADPADPAAWQRGVASILNRSKSCPAAAGAGKRIGTVQLRFSVDASGRIGAIGVARSSGNPDLDRAALDLARHASPLPLPPSGRAVSVAIPVRFAC